MYGWPMQCNAGGRGARGGGVWAEELAGYRRGQDLAHLKHAQKFIRLHLSKV